LDQGVETKGRHSQLERDEWGRKIRAQEPKKTRKEGKESITSNARKQELEVKP
jgi:hypothetical protein